MARLVVYGGRYPGVGSLGSDVTTNVNPTVLTWTQYSITINPSENCVVPIFFEVYDTAGSFTAAHIGKMVSS